MDLFQTSQIAKNRTERTELNHAINNTKLERQSVKRQPNNKNKNNMRSSLLTLTRRASQMAARSSSRWTVVSPTLLTHVPTTSRSWMSTQQQSLDNDNNVEVMGGLTSDQIRAIDDLVGKVDKLEAHVRDLKAQMGKLDPTFGVDGPDGDPLGHEMEELQEVEHIIEEAALHEDKDHVNKIHKLEEDVKKFHAKDPEHDW